MNPSNNFASKSTTGLYLIKTAWEANGANWTSPWTTAGGDYDENSPVQTLKNKIKPDKDWHTLDVTKQIIDMHKDILENNGFIFVPSKVTVNMEGNDVFTTSDFYYSSENSNTSLRPKLVITFENPTPILSDHRDLLNNAITTVNTIGNELMVSFHERCNGHLTIYTLQGKNVFMHSINAVQGQNLYIAKQGFLSGMHIIDIKLRLRRNSGKYIHYIQKVFIQ